MSPPRADPRVMPATFQSDPPADIFIPLQPDSNSTNQGPLPAGRRTPQAGVTLPAAKANMRVLGEQFRRANPKWMDKNEGVSVMPLQDMRRWAVSARHC